MSQAMRCYRGPFYHGADYQLTPLTLQLLALLAAQATWWAAVLFGDLAAFLAVIVQVLLQLFGRSLSPAVVKTALIVACTGLAFDAFTVALDLVTFRGADFFGLPLWLGFLWLSFALALPGLWQWLVSRLQQVLLFAVAGPLAYFAGTKLDAITIPQPELYLPLLVLGWLILPWFWHKLHFANESRDAPISN